jgi:hypothetical protein
VEMDTTIQNALARTWAARATGLGLARGLTGNENVTTATARS